LNGFLKNTSMVFIPAAANGQICLGTPSVFFHFVVCICNFLSAKNIRSHYDIGKMTEKKFLTLYLFAKF